MFMIKAHNLKELIWEEPLRILRMHKDCLKDHIHLWHQLHLTKVLIQNHPLIRPNSDGRGMGI